MNGPLPRAARRTLLQLAATLVTLATLAGCAVRPAPRPGPPGGWIAVLSAYGPETRANEEAFLEGGTALGRTNLLGIPFRQVRFEGRDLLLFPCGVSLVNAAFTTQLALERFPIRAVLFAGIAGGINPGLQVGDVVVPDQWHHHSEAAYFNPRPDGRGYVVDGTFRSRGENFGFLHPQNVHATRSGLEEPVEMPSFPADPALLDAARRAVRHLPPLGHAGRTSRVQVGGHGVSGPVFMDHREYREWVRRVWQADCLDMESTAIAQVCWANRVPCLVVRSLSDLAGGQEGRNPADANEAETARLAARVLREIVREIPR